MFIDSHCHLHLLADEAGGVDKVVSEAKENQVNHLLTVAIDRSSCQQSIKLAAQYDGVTASVGIHPNTEQQQAMTADELIELAQHDQVIAIGETGLDYFRSEGDLNWQRDRFRAHIAVAKQLNKPLIIHTRQARDDTMLILEQENARDVSGIIHCFTENWATAQRALDIGFYISLSGIVTFKNALDLQAIAKRLPLDRMLIETDSPYLAPVPFRGKTNQPAYVKYIAEFLAKLRGDTIDNIAHATTANFARLFPNHVS